eukprot:TRINITY_DN1315_c1_g1_i1.p1 TRINITY_DN1315_c1_g1~~TRINITY_DN1315_c1_g1_i1.p1  ORF type:complete len:290 (+),score=68.96 TRINITY_DN1315_c1_g1_i1:20-889(+)
MQWWALLVAAAALRAAVAAGHALLDDITAVPGIAVGHARTAGGHSGVTAVLCPAQCLASYAQAGGAPCTAQTDLLADLHFGNPSVSGVVLTGGSIIGLTGASYGALRYVSSAPTEQFPQRLHVDGFTLPQLPAAGLLDLAYQQSVEGGTRADLGSLMGQYVTAAEQACAAAVIKDAAGKYGPVQQGSQGAGTGSVAGQYCFDVKASTKGGIGSAAVALEDNVVIGVIIAVNVFGAVLSDKSEYMTGCRHLNGSFIDPERFLGLHTLNPEHTTNTAIGVVATNVPLDKPG